MPACKVPHPTQPPFTPALDRSHSSDGVRWGRTLQGLADSGKMAQSRAGSGWWKGSCNTPVPSHSLHPNISPALLLQLHPLLFSSLH